MRCGGVKLGDGPAGIVAVDHRDAQVGGGIQHGGRVDSADLDRADPRNLLPQLCLQRADRVDHRACQPLGTGDRVRFGRRLERLRRDRPAEARGADEGIRGQLVNGSPRELQASLHVVEQQLSLHVGDATAGRREKVRSPQKVFEVQLRADPTHASFPSCSRM